MRRCASGERRRTQSRVAGGCIAIAAASACADASLDIGHFDAGSDNRAGLVFSPDGQTAYWTEWDGAWGASDASARTIFWSSYRDGGWSTPQAVAFTDGHSDDDPFVTPDGQWLYFVSDRPEGSDDHDRDTNVWRYRLAEPHTLELLPWNSAGDEYSPVVVASGSVYFAADTDRSGDGDVYVVADAQGAKRLGSSVNSAHGEWNLWVAPDETEMVFEASGRATNLSVPGDLYYSRWSDAGWTEAVPIGALNSKGSDLLPRLHPQNGTLIYTTAAIGGHAELRVVAWSPLRDRLRDPKPR
ncbi:MAG: hypothetical protein AAFM91_12060 [Pseudomonadota bacterium]